jgi:MoxR-like ATPase
MMTDPTTVNESFGKLRAIEAELGAFFVEREDVVRAMLLALLSREHLALIGPPGAAKSMLIIELARRVGDSAGAGLRCFVYLLTRFTTPEELFGPVSIPKIPSCGRGAYSLMMHCLFLLRIDDSISDR